MRLAYEFPNIPALKELKILVENKGQDIVCEVSGPNSEQLAAPIRAYFSSFNEMRPLVIHEGVNWYSLYWPPVPSQSHARFVEGFWRSWFFHQPIPNIVTLAITEKCQCKCFHCSANFGLSPTPPQLTVNEVAKIVKESLDLGVANIIFTGGEPLLHENIRDCIALVPPDKAICQMFTNGVALDSKRARSLKSAGLSSVKVSLDSPDPEEHERLRGRKGTFSCVERAVKGALDAGLLVGLSTYATNETVTKENLPRIVELAHQWGVHEVSVFDAVATGRLLRSQEAALTLTNRKLLLEQGRKIQKEYHESPRIITQSWTNSDHRFAKYLGCLAGSAQFHVTASGEFTPCDFTPLTFGNALTVPINALWKKLVEHPAYREHCQTCRMQAPTFREQYIDTIPADATFPYPVEFLEPRGADGPC